MPTLNEQIDKLLALGITFKFPKEELLQKLTEYVGEDYYEKEPYMLLLNEIAMFGFSGQLLTFDLESAESSDVYEYLITEMIGLSQGQIQISDLHGTFDPKQDATDISFVYEGKQHEISVMNTGDWLDIYAFERVATIVQRSDRRFMYRVEDQSVIIIFCNEAGKQGLEQLTNKVYTQLG
ncbi:hypothetical protein [Saccharibacillus sp. JS10]|uniref:hypothetical protein n=1 Tax=Saccharibacillus sp. JS10 TaxID=2950552 RepID=UPI00210B23AF|nr:hypothetical protein [Saccharibacillus sp. JS10]MCQ4088374.1 hypothetical protein [Saccharibacillus sp. JS10]